MGERNRYGRGTAAYRRAQARLKAQHIRDCWLCGEPIDYSGSRSARSFSLDHRTPMAKDPSIENLLNPAGHRPAHLGCNSARKDADLDITGTSRDWTSETLVSGA